MINLYTKDDIYSPANKKRGISTTMWVILFVRYCPSRRLYIAVRIPPFLMWTKSQRYYWSALWYSYSLNYKGYRFKEIWIYIMLVQRIPSYHQLVRTLHLPPLLVRSHCLPPNLGLQTYCDFQSKYQPHLSLQMTKLSLQHLLFQSYQRYIII